MDIIIEVSRITGLYVLALIWMGVIVVSAFVGMLFVGERLKPFLKKHNLL